MSGSGGADWPEFEAEREALVAGDSVAAGRKFTCVFPSAPKHRSCWGEAGHYYAALFALQAAGLTYELAEKLAFCAQMGDEVSEMDAIEQGKRYLKWNAAIKISYTKDYIEQQQHDALLIQRGLHCLTGASSRNETNWRIHWLETKGETPSAFAIGLGIHALGDSYSHRMLSNEGFMYEAPYGHSVAALEANYKLKHNAKPSYFPKVDAARKAYHRAHAPDEIDERPPSLHEVCEAVVCDRPIPMERCRHSINL